MKKTFKPKTRNTNPPPTYSIFFFLGGGGKQDKSDNMYVRESSNISGKIFSIL